MKKVPYYVEVVKAGFPSPASDYEENRLDFNQLLISNPASTFCLRVSGHSMIDAGLYPNDILVVDRSLNPKVGDIVIASLGGEFTVKRLHREEGRFLLKAESPDYRNIEIENLDDFMIFGVVCSVVRLLKGNSTYDRPCGL